MKSKQLYKTLLFGILYTFMTGNQVMACSITASFTYTDSSGFLKFKNTSTGGNRSVWNFGSSAKYMDQYIYYKTPGTYTVIFTVMDTLNKSCFDTFSAQITTNGVCWVKANFQSKESTTLLNRVRFAIATNYLGDVNYWSYGDGGNSNYNGDHEHTYKSAGFYKVWFKTSQSGIPGCVDSISETMYLAPCTVKADFTVTDKGNLNVQFINKSTDANKYNWRLGDGTSFTIFEFWHLYPDDGTYNVRLIAKQTGKDICADTMTKRVFGYSCKIKANFTHEFKDDVRNRNFINKSKSATFFQWDFGDTTYSTEEFPTHAYARKGIYKVKLIVYDTGLSNCADTFISDIGAYDCNVKAKIGFKDSLGFVKYTSLSTGANKNYWSIYAGSPYPKDSLYLDSFSRRYTKCTSVYMTLASYDTLALCSDFTSSQALIQPIVPKFEVKADTNNNYAGLIIDKSAYSVSAAYLWEFGDGDTSTSKTPTHTYSGSGPYTLCLTLTGSSCKRSWCDTIAFDTSGRLKRSFKRFTIKVTTEDQMNTSIVEQWSAANINTYPNPFSNTLIIKSDRLIKSTRLMGIDGAVLFMLDVNGMETELNTGNLSTGLYLLEIEMADGSKMCRRVLRS